MNLIRIKSDYRIALERYRDCKHSRDRVLESLRTCYEAIATGTIHGRKEQSMLNRITELNGALYKVSIDLAYAENNLNKVAKKKEGYYE